jgi:hypothetical protein
MNWLKRTSKDISGNPKESGILEDWNTGMMGF